MKNCARRERNKTFNSALHASTDACTPLFHISSKFCYTAILLLGLSSCSTGPEATAESGANTHLEISAPELQQHKPKPAAGKQAASVVVPDVFLRRPDRAKTILQRAGLKVRTIQLARGLPPYRITDQSPNAGTTVSAGDTVRIYPS